MKEYTIKEMANICKKSERTIYRKLKSININHNETRTDPKKGRVYNENILNQIQGLKIDIRKDLEIEYLKKEIESLKAANKQLSFYAQEALNIMKLEKLSNNIIPNDKND